MNPVGVVPVPARESELICRSAHLIYSRDLFDLKITNRVVYKYLECNCDKSYNGQSLFGRLEFPDCIVNRTRRFC